MPMERIMKFGLAMLIASQVFSGLALFQIREKRRCFFLLVLAYATLIISLICTAYDTSIYGL